MTNNGTCKYCGSKIIWADKKPFEADGQTPHTFNLCSEKRVARKLQRRKEARLAQKETFESAQAKFPTGSHIINFVDRFTSDARYAPIGVVVAHTKFKSKYTAPLVVKKIGHGDHEDQIAVGEFAKVVPQEKYEEVLKSEINRCIALIYTYARTLGLEYLKEQIYKRSHHLGDGSPRDLSFPEFFWDRLYLETAKKCIEEKEKNQPRKDAHHGKQKHNAGSQVAG